MTIGNRLTAILILTSIGVFSIISLGVYYALSLHRSEVFFEQERKQINRIKADFLENNENAKKSSKVLPSEQDTVFLVNKNIEALKDSLKIHYPAAFVEQLFSKGKGQFEEDTLQGIGEIIHEKNGDYVFIVMATDHYGLEQLSYLKWILLICFLLGIAAIAFVGRWFVGRALQPLQAKIDKAQHIGAGNLNERLNVKNKHDEIGKMAIAFNEMLNRLENVFEAQKQFIGNASHEIRNPLTAIMGEADWALQKNRTPEEYQKALKSINHATERLNILVENLLKLAQTSLLTEAVCEEVLALDELLFDVVSELNPIFPNRIEIEIDESLADAEMATVLGNRSLLFSAFRNLFQNACKFSNQQPVQILLKKTDSLQIEIRDRGIGIPAAQIPQVTKALFRGENARGIEGFGLGLTLSQKIIDLHKGQLIIHSEEQGTTVTVLLPVMRVHF